MDIQKLRSKMVLHGDTNITLSKAIGISPQRFSAKINETNGAEFKQKEIAKIKTRYQLTSEEIDEIFFGKIFAIKVS
ncbi:MAG: XRE family transcriptional regulator [Clostridia bacterium]|nr:XRE family transcriptional regulator [Clostridia bacterium]